MSLTIYDTTLRDGAQHEGISFSLEEKLRLTRRLDEIGLHYIEGGWPGSNPTDTEYFRQVRNLELRNSRAVAFSFIGKIGTPPEEDAALRALLDAETEIVTVVGKSSDLHVERVLRTTLEANVHHIRDCVRFLCGQGRRVFYDAEQFFDGYKRNAAYAVQTLRAAQEGGAEVLVLCDTNGGTMPWEIESIMSDLKNLIATPLGIHTHDDSGMAVANSLAAVRAGAVQIQGTMNGYGERVGNANLCTLLPTLGLKMGIKVIEDRHLTRLTEIARDLADVAALPLDAHAPYVGRSAFAHKAGLHADATRKYRQSYQHVPPEAVGNHTRIVVSELSGKANILLKLEELGLARALTVEEAGAVARRIKQLESEGFAFEQADGSIGLLAERERHGYVAPFELVSVRLTLAQDRPVAVVDLLVTVRAAGATSEGRGRGTDVLEALEAALRDGLRGLFPDIDAVSVEAWDSKLLGGLPEHPRRHRVLVGLRSGPHTYKVVGCAAGLVEAAACALADGFEYALIRSQTTPAEQPSDIVRTR